MNGYIERKHCGFFRRGWRVILVAMPLAIPTLPVLAQQIDEEKLATGFVWPVLSDYTVDPRKNTADPRVKNSSCSAGKWYVDTNDFGNPFCPGSLGCSGPDCYHPGEDWHRCPVGASESGVSVYSIANGTVVAKGKLKSDGSTGYYLTIKHALAASRQKFDYAYPGTDVTGSFSELYSSYLHINNPTLSVDDVVSKGEQIATISSCCAHLHFEIQTAGVGVNHCEGCGYCDSLQELTDVGYLHPAAFILDNTIEVRAFPVGSPESGLVRLKGRPGFFGDDQGDVSFYACLQGGTQCLTAEAQILAWYSDDVGVQIFSPDFHRVDFRLPLKIQIERSTGEKFLPILYPFGDVEVRQWFAGSLVDLWKADVVTGVGDTNLFWPEADITRAAFVKMLVAASGFSCDDVDCSSEPSFQDIDTQAWYYPTLRVAFSLGWIEDAPSFRPADAIVRAEVATMISRMIPTVFREPSPEEQFADVQDSSQWYFAPVYTVRDNNIMNGYPAGVGCDGELPGSEAIYFCPGQPIKRSEAAKVVATLFPYRSSWWNIFP